MKLAIKWVQAFNKMSSEVKAAYIGIVVTFCISLYTLYLQNNEAIEFKAIVKFHGTTTLSESVEYRLSLINSGNTPISIQRVHFGIVDLQGQTVNSKTDVIKPISLKPKSIEILSLNRYFMNTDLRGPHELEISFEVVDVNAKVYVTSLNVGQISIGQNLINPNTRLPSFKVDLISGTFEKLNM
ncbi:hypothetical protein AADZ91_07210 [Colwelliaceae bacterium 6441]